MQLLIHDYAGHAAPVELSRELARRGHEVVHAFAEELLTPRGGLTRKVDDPPGLSFRGIPMNPNYRRDKYRFARRRAYERDYGHEFARVIRTLQPSLVLSGNTPSGPQWTAIKSSNQLGIPFISWIQDFYSLAVSQLLSKRSAILGWIAGTYYTGLDRRCLKHSAHSIAITDDFIPILSNFGVPRERISVIENWGAIAELPQRDKNNDWANLHELSGRHVLMYSGTLAMKHNPDLLVQLANRFQPEPHVKVVVVSEGPGADFLKERIVGENITNLLVLPFQPFDAMPDVLGSADVLLALLEPDAGIFSVPSKVLSYLCAGKPTLAAIPRENLSARLLAKINAGVVVDPGDVDGFVMAAQMLLADEQRRSTMGNAARSHAETNFQKAIVADRFEQVFGSTLKTAKTAQSSRRSSAALLGADTI